MKPGVKILMLVLIIMALPVLSPATSHGEETIQMAILLDTSGSMEGLIEQAKSQLWKIVNELALSKKNGKSPKLEVALYEYGKDSIPAGEGHLRMIVPLTTDLDNISEELFKLKTNGGSEYCGRVIQSAVRGLQWSASNDDLKVIFIAGNEPFTQGAVDYKVATKEAVSRGIMVNTIFCGDHEEGIRTKWKDGAQVAGGKYLSIDQNQQIAHIAAPQDKEITKLGAELNKTYIAYGTGGRAKKERQQEQDKNAAFMSSGSLVQRSVAKASKQYVNAAWDLVDAVDNGSVKLEDVKEEDLPKEMKKMTTKERAAYVESTLKKRKELQKRINTLNKERRAFVEKERKKNAQEGTLDLAIIKSIREQAVKKKFSFE